MSTTLSAAASTARTAESMALSGLGGTLISLVDSRCPKMRCPNRTPATMGRIETFVYVKRLTLNPALAKMGAKRRPRVALNLPTEYGMVASKPRKRRDIQYEVTSGPHHPIHLIESRSRVPVVERVDDVEGRDDVEGGVGKRQGGCGRLGDSRLVVLVGVGETAVGQVDPERRAEPAEHLQVVAGAASAVEDARLVAIDGSGGVLEQRPHETAESVEPEMIALGARSHFEKSIHVYNRRERNLTNKFRGEIDDA